MPDKPSILRFPNMRYEAGQASPYRPMPPQSRHPDAEYGNSHKLLLNWVRHLAHNSSVIRGILSSRVTDGIGPGLAYEPMCRLKNGELHTELNSRLRKIHEDWSRSVDVTGELSRQELERLVWRSNDLDGESFVRRVNRAFTTDRTELPYHLQVIPSEWVPANLTGKNTQDEPLIIHGIGKDEWHRPTRYYLNPNGIDQFGAFLDVATIRSLDSVPADQMWHLKRVDSPDQTRGVSLLHTVIYRIYDLADYMESHRLAARASADLFASINRNEGYVEPSSDETETDADGRQQRVWDFEHLQMIDGLLAGESVNFHDPKHPNQNAKDFVELELRQIAVGTDCGFSDIAQVFDSSYAAQRLEVVGKWRKVERDRSKFIGDFARDALYVEPMRTALRVGRIPSTLLRRADQSTLFDVRIDGPQMPVIDPVKDRQAYEMDQENNWDSRHGIIRKQGNRRPTDVDAEIQSDELAGLSERNDREPLTDVGADNAE